MIRISIFFIVVFLLMGCFNPDDFTEVKPECIISFLSPDTTVMADGKSSASIRISITDEAAQDRRRIILKTTLGSFVGGTGDSIEITARPNAHGDLTSSAALISTSSGEASITARILNVTADIKRKVTFDKQFPSKISVSVDSFAIRNSFQSDVILTAKLNSANNGKPSTGHVVNFTAPFGHFLNGVSTALTDSDGLAKIRYSAGDTSFTGQITLTATTATDVAGSTVSNQTVINVIDDN